MNFTPGASSLIVLNVVMQNQRIFRDVTTFNSFKRHCNALKNDLEKAPKPADSRINSRERSKGSFASPKCWIYSLSGGANSVDQDLARAKLFDLEESMVDPLDNLVGFYSVVGRKQPLQGAPTSVIQLSGGATEPTASHARGHSSGTAAILSGQKPSSGKMAHNHQMTSAGSGSESATMIKQVSKNLHPASSLIGANSEASASNRQVSANNDE